MLVNILVKDNCTGNVHQVGTDPHDSLECWNGVVEYVNLQCMEGTMGGGYSFVEPPDMDGFGLNDLHIRCEKWGANCESCVMEFLGDPYDGRW